MSPKRSVKTLNIRYLQQEDLDSIIRIDSLSTGYPRNLYFERKFKRFFGDDCQLLLAVVAEIDKKVVGYIMGEANSGEYGLSRPVASVDTVGIDPEYKRLGIGQIMLEDYCEVAAKAGIELMTTLVSEEWPDVIEFFKSQGFQPAKMLAFEKQLKPEGTFDR